VLAEVGQAGTVFESVPDWISWATPGLSRRCQTRVVRYVNEADVETLGVYLIGPPNTCIAKIGVSDDPEARLADLQVGSHQPLVLLWKTSGGQGLESALHAYFAPYRIHGEWFDFGEESPTALVSRDPVFVT
jgi:hypothetical protein